MPPKGAGSRARGQGALPSEWSHVLERQLGTVALKKRRVMGTGDGVSQVNSGRALCVSLIHGGWRQPMCDPEGCSTVWGAVGGGGTPPPSEGGGGPHPPPSLTQTQHLFRQAPSKRANTQS